MLSEIILQVVSIKKWQQYNLDHYCGWDIDGRGRR